MSSPAGLPAPAVGPTRAPFATGVAIVLGSAALFGMLGPLARFAYEAGMEPTGFVAWRAIFGFLGLALYVALRVGRGASRLIRPRDLPHRARVMLLVAAAMATTLNICMFIAFDRITVALALLGFYTYPALAAVTNVLLGRERMDGTRALALLLAIGGMIAVVASQLDPAGGLRFDGLGIGLALGAAVSQTVFMVVSRDGYPEVPAEQAMAVILIASAVGAASLALIGGAAGSLTYPLGAPDVLPLLLFTGIVAAAIPSLGFLTGIRAIGGTRAGILMLFEPVVGVALASWLLAESLVPIQLVGAVGILGAAFLIQRSAREDPTADATDPDRTRPVVVPGGP